MPSSPSKTEGSRVSLLPWCWFALALSSASAAQEPIIGEYKIATTLGREVVILPSTTTSIQTQLKLGPIDGRSYETPSKRVHIVSFRGETFRASTRLEGASSRIVFDPSQRKFVQLLPSIRIELEDYAELDLIAEKIGATKATSFEKLGFAIIDLPETMHPADAIAQLEKFPERPKASIRMRGPSIKWR